MVVGVLVKVKFRKMSKAVLGLDVGGTFIKGVVIENEEVTYQTTLKTHDHLNRWKESALQIIEELVDRSTTSSPAVGVATPGIASKDNRSIFCMPGRLEGLENLFWSDHLGLDAYVLNDAHAALFAESKWGVAKGVNNVIMLTLGTGVGGGLMIDGKLVQGFLQRAGHFGHIAVEGSMNIPDSTGIVGSLEDAVGDETIKQRSMGRFNTTLELVDAYAKGDHWASYIWLSSLRMLTLGIVSLCNAISPEVVILGGGIIKAGEHLIEPIHAFMDQYEWRPQGQATPIKQAEFKEFAGAIGAGLFARSRLYEKQF